MCPSIVTWRHSRHRRRVLMEIKRTALVGIAAIALLTVAYLLSMDSGRSASSRASAGELPPPIDGAPTPPPHDHPAEGDDLPPGEWTPGEGAEMLQARKCPWRSRDGSTAQSSSVKRCS